ncbi:MAG: hypothetical protein A6F72_08335 [Cycloclasticus sp. symbiont of Poecilosclerida sp. N]|nr:MAG: hypothetical protein A6F72_08335 [Cycloclasticus sp. symbiont of Poecilosclerida sp. N]
MGSTVERHTHMHVEEGVQCLWENHHKVNIEYAKYLGFSLMVLGVVGIPYAGEQFLFFVLTPLQNSAHIISGMFLVASVLLFDSSYARLANQIVGPLCIIIAMYGLSGMTPATTLLNLNTAEILFYMGFGMATAYVGWGRDLSHLKHWWP